MSSGDTLVMTQCPRWLCTLFQVIGTLWILLGDSLRCLRLCLRCPTALAAENRFLRKQLALYQEHHVPPQRATAGTRLVLTWLSGWFNGAGPRHCAARHPAPLASRGIAPVLAVEVAPRTATDPRGPASPHPPHGARASHVGPGTDRERTAPQARPAGVPADGPQIYAEAPAPGTRQTGVVTALGNVCARPCRVLANVGDSAGLKQDWAKWISTTAFPVEGSP